MSVLPKRIADRVDASGGLDACWPWTGNRDRDGYGVVHHEISRRAHRVMASMAFGVDAIRDRVVCHACDNPACCNPLHLFIGTHADNCRDRSQKGRSAVGERSPWAKLTEADVAAIIQDKRSQVDIARAYGVSQPLISKIKRREVWAHISMGG